MAHQHPHQYHIQAGLRADLFHALCDATGEGWFGDKTSEALCEAVSNWLARNRSAPEPVAPIRPATGRGYLWKRLFLPDGTLLRTTISGKTYHAKVEGDDLVSDGQKLSPSQFVNGHGGVRNAWRVVWLRFPDGEWERADRCRDASTD